jgi:hypothetical protein
MQHNSYPGQEPLFIVIFRDSQAANVLKEWAKKNGIDQKHVDENRLRLYNQHAWDKFRTTWPRSWDRVTVWDCWNRRHIEVG